MTPAHSQSWVYFLWWRKQNVAVLESKNAGRVLALIVLVLMLPMLLIGGFYYSLARVEINAIESELVGSKLLQTVFPIYMSTSQVASRYQLQSIRELEKALPDRLHTGFAEHLANEQRNKGNLLRGRGGTGKVDGLATYIVETAANSGLALDADAESYFLIDAVILTLPDLTGDIRTIGERMVALAADQKDYKTKFLGLALVQGAALGAQQRFEASLSRSATYGGDAGAVAKIKSEANLLGREIDALSQLLEQSTGSMSFDNYFKFLHMRQSIEQMNKQAWAISAPAFAELDRKLNSRLNIAKSKLFFLSLVGFAAAAMGLGLALQMFKKTLTKLDEVEAARETAIYARGEAERINGEVAVLNRTLADQVKALETAQNEIVKKGRMEQLGQLTATIAHELRNPLGSVRTSAYLINRKVGGKGLGIDEQISRIEKGVVRCDSIITQLLDFSRTKQISATPANLDSWLAGIVTEEANKLPANVQIDCILGLDDRSVPFDPGRLQRAIINMLSNAVEAMTNKDAPGQQAYPQLWISTFPAGNNVGIRVRDNGPGISPDLIKKIREPLFTTKSFGTGLGIPAIEQIAAQHGGHIDIQSTPGEGAVFTIYIPMTQPDSASTETVDSDHLLAAS
jgi:signal transduction histidine kinase